MAIDPVEAAYQSLWEDHGDFDKDNAVVDRAYMRRALAAAYEAEADHVTHTGIYAPTIIEAWLRGRAAALRDGT